MNHWIIFKIAIRNIFLNKMRTFVVGAILAFGAFLAVLGNSFLDGIAGGMKNSVTQSITGDIQIYSEKAKDNLSVFGNMDGTPTDVGHIDRFDKIAELLLADPDISSVVPMGTNFAQVSTENILDYFLEKLRKDYKSASVGSDVLNSEIQRIRFIIQEIQENLSGKFDEIGMLSTSDIEEAKLNLEKVSSDEFWKNFSQDYENKIEFLANKIAPLIFDGNMIFFSYVGTDPQKFKEKFPQFDIVKGEMIPAGQRGFLFHDYFYENYIKHRIARRFDQIKKKMKDDKLTIKDSKELQDQVKASVEQSAEIYLQLGPKETDDVKQKLQMLLDTQESEFRELLKSYLSVTDETFQERYDFFYKEIAPHVVLYRVPIGSVLPMNAFTKSGSTTAINIKVYGTFKFKSFENSPLAGNFSLMDLVSFRELYGFLTEERRAQNKELEAEMGLADVGRDSIEDIFSGTSTVQKAKTTIKQPELKFEKKIIGSSYTQKELDEGVFMHSAVFLKDPSNTDRVIQKLNNLSKEKGLGFKAVSWQDAAGFIGQMTFMMKGILVLFVGISLLLATLMITNSLLMAAMNRKQEIGTIRAIGASPAFVYRMIFYETLVMSLIFGTVGAILGSIVVLWIGKVGIPAQGDVATFFFSGPRLFLHLNPILILVVLILMMIIAVLATQYPAWKAMKISPLQAMQKRE